MSSGLVWRIRHRASWWVTGAGPPCPFDLWIVLGDRQNCAAHECLDSLINGVETLVFANHASLNG